MLRLTRDHTVSGDERYRAFEPALTVDPGETVVVETINHMTPVVGSEDDLQAHGSTGYREREETGPICVRGAAPGDMLAVRIDRIDVVGLPHAQGTSQFGSRYEQAPFVMPVEGGRCRLPGGLSAPYDPVVGEIYTTPADPPVFYDHGGTMDFTEVRPGNTVYLPVFHEGGLLVMGDVHACQGEGEIFGEGAETAADVTVTIDVDRTYRNPRPLIETPDSLITLASRGGLMESLELAIRDMTGLLVRLHGVTEEEAYTYCTVVGSVRVGGQLSRRDWFEERCLVGLSVPKQPAGGTRSC